MRSSTRHAVGGFAAGLFAAVAVASMLGSRAQPAERPKIDPRIEALIRQIKESEDRVAEAQSQVVFWQQEMASDDSEVARLQTEAAASPTVAFFLGRAQGLSGRAANSYLDARLNLTLAQRKTQALKADLAAP
jgi:hypothetical protein